MTKLHILSDIHDDHNADSTGTFTIPPDVNADVIVVAGDICGRLSKTGLRWLEAQARGIPIIVVAGNHDYWKSSIDTEIERFRDSCTTAGIYVLDGDSVVIGGTRFVGGTLWTDYQAWHGDGYTAQRTALSDMNDFKRIRTEDYAKRLMPWMLREVHDRHREAIRSTLATPFAGPTVVVTHHAPSLQSLEHGRVTQPLDAAYASDLTPMIRELQPELWIHGHIHCSRDYQVGGTRIVANPRGYLLTHPTRLRLPPTPENPAFDPRLVVAVEPRPRPASKVDNDRIPIDGVNCDVAINSPEWFRW